MTPILSKSVVVSKRLLFASSATGLKAEKLFIRAPNDFCVSSIDTPDITFACATPSMLSLKFTANPVDLCKADSALSRAIAVATIDSKIFSKTEASILAGESVVASEDSKISAPMPL